MNYRKHENKWIPLKEFEKLQQKEVIISEAPKKDDDLEDQTRSDLYSLAKDQGLDPEWNGNTKEDFIQMLEDSQND